MTPKTEVVYSGRITGISFGHYKFRPDRLRGMTLIIVPEPNNLYDTDAIRLLAIVGTKAVHVGYIPGGKTRRLHTMINAGRKLTAIVDHLDLVQPHLLITTPFVAPLFIPPPLNAPGTMRRILK